MEPVHFTLSEADMLSAQRDFWRGSVGWRKLGKMIFWIWLSYAVLILSVEWFSGDIQLWSTVLGVIGVTLIGAVVITLLLVALGYILIPYHSRKGYRQQEAIRAPTSIGWDAETICISNDYGTSNLPWRSFIGWTDGRDNVLLYQSDRLFNILPKSAVRAAQQAEAIAHLRAANVAEKPAFRLMNL